MSYNSEWERKKSIGKHLNNIDAKVLDWLALTGGDLSERHFSRSPRVPTDTTNLNSSVQEEVANRLYDLLYTPELGRVIETRILKLSEDRYDCRRQAVESNICDELRRQGVQFEMRDKQLYFRNESPNKPAVWKGKLSDQEFAFEGWQHSLPLFQFGAAISKRIHWHHLMVEKGIVERDEDITKSAYKATKEAYVELGFMADDDPVPGLSWELEMGGEAEKPPRWYLIPAEPRPTIASRTSKERAKRKRQEQGERRTRALRTRRLAALEAAEKISKVYRRRR